MQYIAAARWPGFVKPVLDEYQRQRDGDVDMDDEEEDEDMEEEEAENKPKNTFALPSEDTRMRLTRLFNSSFTNALEALLPRISNATDWALSNQPPTNLLSQPLTQLPHPKNELGGTNTLSLNSLPRMSKFVLVASFLASTNPAKSDMRMFGRGLDEKKRKRRARRAGGGQGRRKMKDGVVVAAKVNFVAEHFTSLTHGFIGFEKKKIGPTKIPRSSCIRIR